MYKFNYWTEFQNASIFISGFAANQFNWGSGNENLGNEVTIVSGTQSYATEIHKDGSNENQIQFFTPSVSL